MNEIPSIITETPEDGAKIPGAEELIPKNQDTSIDVSDESSPEVTGDESYESDECACEAEVNDSRDSSKCRDLLTDDARELRARFPELSRIKNVSEIRAYKRYAELRALGLTVDEAYLATSRREEVHDNRAHLTSAVPIAASSPRGISRRELGVARELFSDLSDSEIQALYQRVTK